MRQILYVCEACWHLAQQVKNERMMFLLAPLSATNDIFFFSSYKGSLSRKEREEKARQQATMTHRKKYHQMGKMFNSVEQIKVKV